MTVCARQHIRQLRQGWRRDPQLMVMCRSSQTREEIWHLQLSWPQEA